jgi:hypothetical protein
MLLFNLFTILQYNTIDESLCIYHTNKFSGFVLFCFTHSNTVLHNIGMGVVLFSNILRVHGLKNTLVTPKPILKKYGSFVLQRFVILTKIGNGNGNVN